MTTAEPIPPEGNERWSRASLRIWGESLQPGEIGTLLGLEATGSGVKGERISPSHSALRRTSHWLIQSPLATDLPLEEHLQWLLNLFEPKREILASLRERWGMDFFCGFSSEHGQGGAIFDPELLRRLADFGVGIVLDLYPPGAPLEYEVESPSHD